MRRGSTASTPPVRPTSRSSRASGPITIEADDNVMEYVVADVEAGRLRIKLDTDQRYSSFNNVTFRVTVTH